MRISASPRGPLRGDAEVPGDKSISHRALVLGALARGTSQVTGLLRADDVHRTLACLRACGATIEDGEVVRVEGGGLREAEDVLDCGNSGTTARLLLGALAPVPGHFVLTGDDSLRRRPMGRVVRPLRAWGVSIDGRAAGERLPLAWRGGVTATSPQELPVASAQLKTALLLAGRDLGVRVKEPAASRDHTERMLSAMGADIDVSGGWIRLGPGGWRGRQVEVPGDLSSAAFLLVAASLVPGSSLRLHRVGINPTRAGVFDALRAMGADLRLEPIEGGVEPMATVEVRHAPLEGTRIDGDLALRCLDELPVLAVAAAFARGETVIADAAELRVKESDRVAAVAAGLRSMGGQVEERPDGMRILGGGLRGGGEVAAHGDHRLAMAFAVAGLVAPGGVEVDGAESVATSWPGFFDTLQQLTETG